MNYKVYKHTNKTNNKVYIGITQQKLEKRWQNGYGYKEQIYFYNAIKKYGWDNFNHELLFDNLTEEQAKAIQERAFNMLCFPFTDNFIFVKNLLFL